MDGTTAGFLLGAALRGVSNNNKMADLYKEIKRSAKELDPESVAAADALKGKRVGFKCCGYVGTVEGANTSVGGFYGGDRYPVMVKVDRVNTGQEGVVFEYMFSDLFLLDDPEAKPLTVNSSVQGEQDDDGSLPVG